MAKAKKGQKNDQSKPQVQYIPKQAVFAIGRALGYGAKKYASWNYTKGLEHTRLAAAAIRHIFEWLNGEDHDHESNLCPLDHALASLAMLKYMQEHHPHLDDRYKGNKNVKRKRKSVSVQTTPSRRKGTKKRNTRK